MDASRRQATRDKPLVDTSYQQPYVPSKAPPTTSACDFKDDLLIAVLPLVLIMLAFGGRLSVLVACIGGTVCYIFDIVGSLEGTAATLMLTLLGQVACMVFAARVFLSESLLNFSLICLMWVALFYCFLVCCNYFAGIVNEFGMVLVVMNQLIFVTLPMIAAAIISWFLCVEIPSLDLLLCFNGTYFVYTLYLGRPRLVSADAKKASKGSPTGAGAAPALRSVLPPHLLLMMYIVPIVITILMHVAIHHNVLATTHTRVTNFLLSVLVPSLLMTYCAYKQVVQRRADFHADDAGISQTLPRVLDVSTLILSTALVYCIESHPIMDELKSFSELSDDAAGYAIMAAVGLIFAAFGLHKFHREQSQLLAEHNDSLGIDGVAVRSRMKLKVLSILASFCIGGANALFAIVIGLPDHAIGVSIVGAMALAEYYLHPEWSFASRCLLVFIASLYSSLAAHSFMTMTLQGISYDFHWYVDVSLPTLTTVVNVLVPVAIALPTFVGPATSAAAVQVLGMLPGQFTPTGTESSAGQRSWGKLVFEWVFPVVCAVVAATELMIREQDWSNIRIATDVVYPLYYFIGVAGLVTGTSVVLYLAGTIGPACLWILCVMQACKLLHLVGIPAAGALTACLMILAFTLPFIRTVTRYLRLEQESSTTDNRGVANTPRAASKTALNTLELLAYIIIATLATYWCRTHMLAHNVLQTVLARDPTDLQQTALCAAVWLAYMGCVLAVFYRSAKMLRSVVLVTSGLCMLIALEGFGHLNLTLERTSSAYLTVAFHPDMNVQEHPALFFFLSSALSGLAWVGLIPLNSILLCLLYSLLFGFISAKAMMGWAFPLSLADDTFTHDINAFPFLYLFASKFLLTFVAIWIPPSTSSTSGKAGKTGAGTMSALFTEAPLVFACAVPFFGLLYALSTKVYTQAMPGIVWSAVVGYTTLTLTVRARELYVDAAAVTRSSRFGPPSAGEPATISACLPCAALVVFWTSFAVLSTHGFDRDVYIPLASLTILCTTPGAILRGKSPLLVVGVFCAAFWTCSALYAILIKGYGSDPTLISFEKPQDILGFDSDVSVWTSVNLRWPLINLLQVLVPMPGIVAGLRPQVGRSEDVLFVFALLSLVPVFAAQISSLRYLGVVGMLFAATKAYRLNDQQIRSDRLI